MATPGRAVRRNADATLRSVMRVTITCEDCGRRHRLERQVMEAGPIWIVCHSCELPLQAILEGPSAPAKRTHAVWADILDLGTGISSNA